MQTQSNVYLSFICPKPQPAISTPYDAFSWAMCCIGEMQLLCCVAETKQGLFCGGGALALVCHPGRHSPSGMLTVVRPAEHFGAVVTVLDGRGWLMTDGCLYGRGSGTKETASVPTSQSHHPVNHQPDEPQLPSISSPQIYITR